MFSPRRRCHATPGPAGRPDPPGKELKPRFWFIVAGINPGTISSGPTLTGQNATQPAFLTPFEQSLRFMNIEISPSQQRIIFCIPILRVCFHSGFP